MIPLVLSVPQAPPIVVNLVLMVTYSRDRLVSINAHPDNINPILSVIRVIRIVCNAPTPNNVPNVQAYSSPWVVFVLRRVLMPTTTTKDYVHHVIPLARGVLVPQRIHVKHVDQDTYSREPLVNQDA